MKTLNLLLLLAVLTIVGCSQENELPQETNEQFSFEFEEKYGTVIISDFDNLSNTDASISLEKNNGNSSHAHGNYNFTNSAGFEWNLDFSMTENNGGTHGSLVYTLVDDGGLGLIEGIVATADTQCVIELDNGNALIIGEVTQSEPAGFWPIGSSIIAQVVDNGEGKNAASDQAYNLAIVFIDGVPSCDFLINPVTGQTFIEFLASFPFFGISLDDIGNNSANMQSPYSIKVN